ncbi:hypothetical protein [Amycolatopsis sp. lyj-112]|uniref:hypothetical protein n=1 Tax=Amycolatopsis sp. lyj-112 TaxID=2789288 RepID=UPI00397BC50B
MTGMNDRETRELAPWGRLEPGVRGDSRISVSIGPGGELVALWSAASDVDAFLAMTTDPGGARFPDPRTPRPVTARVTVQTPDSRLLVRLTDVPLAYPSVQPMPDGHLLLVGSRARWRPEGADRNAILYDSAGNAVAEATLGDGIQHVMTTGEGKIWAGYFDEGVYGNYGWGFEGPEPLGAAGLVRYTPELRRDWSFPLNHEQFDGIDDCYALNVDGETAWVCYYADFPVARIRDGVVKFWENDVAGAKAIAVADDVIAFCGGYSPHYDRLVLARLGDDRTRITGEYRLTLPGGEPIPAGSALIGRGSALHVVTEDTWYRLDITHPL